MSRSNNGILEVPEEDIVQDNYEQVEKVVKNCPEDYDPIERVLAIDADSILYYASYFPEGSFLEFPTPEAIEEEAKFRVRSKLQEIQINVEQWFNIKITMVFIGGRGNIRDALFPEYKALRRQKPVDPLIPMLKKYMIEELNAITSDGGESDDYCYEIFKSSNGNCVISSPDKDVLYYCPDTPIYCYRTHGNTMGEFKYIDKKASRLAIATQIVTGDATDGVPGAKGVGAAWCKKNLHEDMTDRQFIKAIFEAYIKANKGNQIEAKNQLRLYYQVLKLYTVVELRKIFDRLGKKS